MKPHIILGAHITDRMKNAEKFQKVLSQYGCHVKTRIGLHEVSEQHCSPEGVVLLEIFGDEAVAMELKAALNAIDGIESKELIFRH